MYQSVSMAEHLVCCGTGIKILSMSGVQFFLNGSVVALVCRADIEVSWLY